MVVSRQRTKPKRKYATNRAVLDEKGGSDFVDIVNEMCEMSETEWPLTQDTVISNMTDQEITSKSGAFGHGFSLQAWQGLRFSHVFQPKCGVHKLRHYWYRCGDYYLYFFMQPGSQTVNSEPLCDWIETWHLAVECRESLQRLHLYCLPRSHSRWRAQQDVFATANTESPLTEIFS